MKNAISRGVRFKYDWFSFEIGYPINIKFEAYCGHRVFDVTKEDAEKIMYRKALYEIKKWDLTG